jgi:galactokinase
MDLQLLERAFSTHFNAKADFIVRAPGRVNLIGEHTDYNEGYVLPMAIDRSIWLALRPRPDSMVRVRSLDLTSESAFELGALTRGKGWAEYLKGVANQLMSAGYSLKGFDAVMIGDVPRGAGLSSSAAVELACARAFAEVSGFEWDAPRMARLAQKAENEWVGVKCGIMDQMASAASRAGHALFLDCRSLEYRHVRLPENAAIVILDTSTRRGLVDSAYNERRTQCEQAARWFGVKALRDVSVKVFEERTSHTEGLDETVHRRARHIVYENERVLNAVEGLKAGNVYVVGELFNASHDSLRDDFEVTNEALNLMVECARRREECFGARMTGAGFGGCAVALVKKEGSAEFSRSVAEDYRQRSGLAAAIYVCQPAEGASLVK